MTLIGKFLQMLYPSLRRRYFYYCRKAYIAQRLATRQGGCAGCGGQCCQRTRKCPFLKEGLCSRYERGIFRFCKIFPIDPQDIILSGVADVCRYYWEGEGIAGAPGQKEAARPKTEMEKSEQQA